MNAACSRRIKAGKRALAFCQAHPDSEPGAALMVAKLEQLIARADEASTVQRDGLVRERAASEEKVKLRLAMRDLAIPHLSQVGREAAREKPELAKVFRYIPGASSHLAFQTAARSMVTAAQTHLERMVKYGLSQSVLDELVQKLDEFGQVVALGNEGRVAHAGATREIHAVSGEIFRALQIMDGRNRQRFANDPMLLGAWITASKVGRTPEPSTPTEGAKPEGGEVKPA
jgi:hypothetical protein